ncbi:hypothetical protein ACI1US_01157 [Leucobacter sp. BZR 635]
MTEYRARHTAAHIVVGALVAVSLVAGGSPATALDQPGPKAAAETPGSATVTTAAELEAAVAQANAHTDETTIRIGGDIVDADLLLAVTAPLRIEVSGHTVSSVRFRASADLALTGPGSWVAGRASAPDLSAAPGIGISAGATATISGLTLDARGTRCDAAIGGWNLAPAEGCNAALAVGGGTVVITGSTVTATGYLATAIGSDHGEKTTISIVDSVVSASTNQGAAIGSGDFGFASEFVGHSGPITIRDSAVTARTSDTKAAAIGAAAFGVAEDISILGGKVTAGGSGGYAAGGIGNGAEAVDNRGGALTLGTTTLDTSSVRLPATLEVGATLTTGDRSWTNFRVGLTNHGTVQLGADARLYAGTAIQNNGTIRPAANVGHDVVITGNAFAVRFDANGVNAGSDYPRQIYAPTFAAAGERLFPIYGPSDKVFASWNTAADGNGPAMTVDTELAPLAGPAGEARVYAQWIDNYVTLSPDDATVVAGAELRFTSSAPLPGGGETDVSYAVELSSSEASDTFTDGVLAATRAGQRTVTATYEGATATAEVTVLPDELSQLAAQASARTVTPGATVQLTAVGSDRFGNAVVLDDAEIAVTSSNAADKVAGLRVQLVGEGERTLTLKVGEHVASVEVAAVPKMEPDAGGPDGSGDPDDSSDPDDSGDPGGTDGPGATDGPGGAGGSGGPGAVSGAGDARSAADRAQPLAASGAAAGGLAACLALLAGGLLVLSFRRRARS